MQDDAIIGFIPVREAIYGLARHDEEEGEQNKDKKAKEKKQKEYSLRFSKASCFGHRHGL